MEITILSWSDFKNIVANKSLYIQYYDQGIDYLIWASEPNVTYKYTIWKSGYEPLDSDAAQIASDRTDFETNQIPIANINVAAQPSLVQLSKQSFGSLAWTFSHLWTDKTTWFGDAVQVTNETLGTGNGTTTTFNFTNPYVIDVVHGKITNEDYLVPTANQGGTSYLTTITVGGTAMTEQVFASTGGDYTIDYAAGTITFAVAPVASAAVVATQYFYSPANAGSTMYIRPATGKKTVITSGECQFSADFVMTGNLYSAIFAYNPELGAPPAKFEVPGSRSTFKRVWDFINWTNGAWPAMPPFGGTRGYTQNSYQLTFDYNVTTTLDDTYGVEMRLWVENDLPYTGEYAQLTFYGFQPIP